MNDEYKTNLLKYLTNSIDEETGKNVPNLNSIEELTNNIVEYVSQYYNNLTSLWDISFIIQRGDYIICVCLDYNESGTYRGKWKKTFIVVLDTNYIPVKYIDTYNDGTSLGCFIKYNDNDTKNGNLYFIDIVFSSIYTINTRRLLIINDFTLNNFEIILLNSFNIPSYNDYKITIDQLIKDTNTGRYFMVYHYTTGYDETGKSIDYGGALEFINNVGSDNEWNFYPYTGNKDINWYGWTKGLPIWSDEGLTFKILCGYEVSSYNGNTTSIVVLKENIDENNNKSSIEFLFSNLPNECKNVGQILNNIVIGSNVAVVTQTTGSDLQPTKYVIEYSLDDLTYKLWYSKEDYITNYHTSGYDSSYDEIELISVNNQLFFTRTYRYYSHNMETNISTYYNNDQYLYQVFNNNVYEFYLFDLQQTKNVSFNISYRNIYNLYEFGLIYQDRIIKVKEIFNQLNYNGMSFDDKNSLFPFSSNLYDNNKDIIFARNLYNKTISNNTTEAIIEVPNVYLNDKAIATQELISINNNTIIKNKNLINKNIYETLFINFFNTLEIINKNDKENPVTNKSGAIRLNNSISNLLDYDETKITKAKINYEDSTTKTIDIKFNLKDGVMQTSFFLYVDKKINTIDLISNDENTIYQTITGTFEIGKNYTVKQDVTVI